MRAAAGDRAADMPVIKRHKRPVAVGGKRTACLLVQQLALHRLSAVHRRRPCAVRVGDGGRSVLDAVGRLHAPAGAFSPRLQAAPLAAAAAGNCRRRCQRRRWRRWRVVGRHRRRWRQRGRRMITARHRRVVPACGRVADRCELVVAALVEHAVEDTRPWEGGRVGVEPAEEAHLRGVLAPAVAADLPGGARGAVFPRGRLRRRVRAGAAVRLGEKHLAKVVDLAQRAGGAGARGLRGRRGAGRAIQMSVVPRLDAREAVACNSNGSGGQRQQRSTDAFSQCRRSRAGNLRPPELEQEGMLRRSSSGSQRVHGRLTAGRPVRHAHLAAAAVPSPAALQPRCRAAARQRNVALEAGLAVRLERRVAGRVVPRRCWWWGPAATGGGGGGGGAQQRGCGEQQHRAA